MLQMDEDYSRSPIMWVSPAAAVPPTATRAHPENDS
jgi:hypothetical protein